MTQGNQQPHNPQSQPLPAATRDFLLLLIGVFLTMFARQMLTVAIGWELYERTNSALVLGGVGLAQVIPVIALFLPSGYISDRYSRKSIILRKYTIPVTMYRLMP